MGTFKLMVIDADTPLFKSAKSVQKDYIIARNNNLGITKVFDNRTQLWGHHLKKEGGWLAEFNAGLEEKSKPEDWDVEDCAELSKEIKDPLEEAFMTFNQFVGKMKRSGLAEDYVLCLGGEGNFRYDAAQFQPYKGDRKDKPLIFQELKDKVVMQYGKKVVLANGCEADDILSQYGWKNYLNYRKTGEWEYLLAYLDKDLKMVISPNVNYDDPLLKVEYNSPEECARCFCVQLLAGDQATDNIRGLPNFTEEIQQKYELGKTRGIGVATAQRMLRTAESPKEMYERVVEAYKSYYGESTIHTFVNFRGDELNWTWLDFLQDNAILLWMQRAEGERISIEDTLRRMEVNL